MVTIVTGIVGTFKTKDGTKTKQKHTHATMRLNDRTSTVKN